MAVIVRTAKEIDDVLGKVEDGEASAYPGMTYEQGIAEALRWVLGEQDEAPLADA